MSSHIELEHSNKKMVQFAEEVEVKTVKREPEVVEVEIDERKMDRLLHLLHEADPQCDNSDPQEMLDLEGSTFASYIILYFILLSILTITYYRTSYGYGTVDRCSFRKSRQEACTANSIKFWPGGCS